MTDARQTADRLRDARERDRLTAEELIDLLGLQRGSIEFYKLTQEIPSRTTLLDIAGALRIPASELLSHRARA